MVDASDIAFSQVREDPLLDERMVRLLSRRRGRPVTVLMIASGGCTALGLVALPEVERVIAIDPNPAQLCGVELRRQAMEHLAIDDQLRLLGGDGLLGDDGTTPQVRRELYGRVRPHLPAATREHWDARTGEVEAGLLHVGRFEALFRHLSAALSAAGLDPLGRAAEAVASPAWRATFEQVFERGELARIFGPAAVDYSMDRSFGHHFADVFGRAVSRWGRGDNYFLHQVFEQRYLEGPGGRPPCLEPSVQAAARDRGMDRLELVRSTFAEALASLDPGPGFDLVQTSNISDWMPVPALRAMLHDVRRVLSPGGAVLGRRLNGDHHLAAVLGDVLEVDGPLSAELLAADRSFFYREVVAAFAPGGGS